MIPQSGGHFALLAAAPILAATYRFANDRVREQYGFRSALIQIATGAVLFAALGPLIGGVIAGTLFVLVSGHAVSILDGTILILGCVVVTYFECLFPAAMTGIVAGALRPWLLNWQRLLAFGAIGTGLTFMMINMPQVCSGLLAILPRRLLQMLTGEPTILIASYVTTVLVAACFCRGALQGTDAAGDNGADHA